ncbi:MAG: hypothetical protein MRJ96_14405 [Nitrospirales bacterium]|nr:hypothetical protein [Nitrospirales bacterium]
MTPEYFANLPVFAQHFFEQFYRKLKTPFLLVFDNYHELPLDSSLHTLVLKAIEGMPAHGTMLIMSRNVPPPMLARVQVEQRMRVGRDSDEIGQNRFPRLKPGESIERPFNGGRSHGRLILPCDAG